MGMPDKEKVIKGLECCLGANDCDVEPEEDCPYKGMCLCAMALRLDVLALLKEQEAVEPRIQTDFDGKGTWWYICGSCNNAISPKDKYCRECGKMVKWDD